MRWREYNTEVNGKPCKNTSPVITRAREETGTSIKSLIQSRFDACISSPDAR